MKGQFNEDFIPTNYTPETAAAATETATATFCSRRSFKYSKQATKSNLSIPFCFIKHYRTVPSQNTERTTPRER